MMKLAESSKRQVLLLDLDGTLVNSSDGIYRSFGKACEALCLKKPVRTEFESHIGPSISSIFKSFFANCSLEQSTDFERLFRESYNSNDYKLSYCYPDVSRYLRLISNNNSTTVSIVTNKPTLPALKLLSYLGLSKYFDLVIGSDFLHHHSRGKSFSSKSEALKFAITHYSVESSHVHYLGDTKGDLEACLATNIHFIAATYGFYSWTPIELASLSYIDRFSKLIYFLSL